MKLIVIAAALVSGSTLFAQTVTTHVVTQVPPDLTRKSAEVMARLSPSAKAKVQRLAATLVTKVDDKAAPARIESTISDAVTRAFPDVKLPAGDLAALTLIVATGLAQSSETELRAAATEIDKIGAQKEELRKRLAATQAAEAHAATRPGVSLTTAKVPPSVVKAPAPLAANAPPQAIQERLTQLSDISESNQLRLQMLADRRAKLLELLSNVLKKASDTQGSIIANLK